MSAVVEPSEVLIALADRGEEAVVIEVGEDVGSFECGDRVDLFGCVCIDPEWQTWRDVVRVVRVPLAEYNLFPHQP